MIRQIVVLACASALAACATQPAREFSTPSGRPEAIFPSQTTNAIIGKLAGLCMDRQGIVINQDTNQVLCQKTLDPGDAILAQLLIGNQYSTTPVLKIRFNAVQIDTSVRVQVYEWLETQMAFGQVRTTEMNSNAEFNKIENLLSQLGGQVSRVSAQ